MRLAPDGRSLAWLSHVEGEDCLAVATMADGQVIHYALAPLIHERVTDRRTFVSHRLSAVGTRQMPGGYYTPVFKTSPQHATFTEIRTSRINRRPTGLEWRGNNDLLLTLSTGSLVFTLGSKKVTPLWGLERGTAESSARLPFRPPVKIVTPPSSSDAIYLSGDRSPPSHGTDLFRCAAETGHFVRVAQNPGPITQWIFGADETILFGLGQQDGLHRLFRRKRDSDTMEVVGELGAAPCELLSYDDSRGVLHLVIHEGDAAKLGVFNPDTGTWRNEPVEIAPTDTAGIRSQPRLGDLEVSGPVRSGRDGRILGWRSLGPRMTTRWFEKPYQDHQKTIDQARPGWTNLVLETDAAEECLLVLSFTVSQSAEISAFNTESGTMQTLMRLDRPIPRCGIAGGPARFQAADGTELFGWIVFQANQDERSSSRPRPLVVLMHTEPYAPWIGDYHDLAAFLASRGYAVLQLNHRGTGGRGRELLEAGRVELGREVPADLDAAVAQLAASGRIDDTRVAVIGSGYGAHLALRALARKESRFTAGVAISPVVDWGAFVWAGESEARRHWIRDLGLISDDDDASTLTGNSAVTFARELSRPLLVIQGRDDAVAPDPQVAAFLNQLRERQAQVEHRVMKGAGFCITEEEPRAALFEHIERFLERVLDGSPPVAAPPG